MTADEKRREAARLIQSRIRKNGYTQGANRSYVFGKPEGAETGYGDCSSTVREVIRRAAGIDIGANTSAQIANRARALMVEDNRDGARSFPTIGRLLPGDCVYFRGTPGHTWDVGHVEMVTGHDECCGHGSGVGPVRRNLTAYSKGRTGSRKYLCTLRWIQDDPPQHPGGENPASAAGILRITGGTVHVRETPSTDKPPLAIAKKGDVFPLKTGAANGFYAVEFRGATAYISAKYAETM